MSRPAPVAALVTAAVCLVDATPAGQGSYWDAHGFAAYVAVWLTSLVFLGSAVTFAALAVDVRRTRARAGAALLATTATVALLLAVENVAEDAWHVSWLRAADPFGWLLLLYVVLLLAAALALLLSRPWRLVGLGLLVVLVTTLAPAVTDSVTAQPLVAGIGYLVLAACAWRPCGQSFDTVPAG